MNKNNQVLLTGTLHTDIEVKQSTKGQSFAKFQIACSRESGTWKDYISCIAWGNLADQMYNLKKSTPITIKGSIQTGSYMKDGKKIYTTDVQVTDITLIGCDQHEQTQFEKVPDLW